MYIVEQSCSPIMYASALLLHEAGVVSRAGASLPPQRLSRPQCTGKQRHSWDLALQFMVNCPALQQALVQSAFRLIEQAQHTAVRQHP